MEKIKAHLDNIDLVCGEVLSIHRNTINKALALKDRYGYSYYDCLMLASALDAIVKLFIQKIWAMAR